MIGWDNVLSRDYAEAVENGQVDSDLESILQTIQARKLAKLYPPCPTGCGEVIKYGEPHKCGNLIIALDT